MINLLELLGGPGRYILGLGPPPWPARAPSDNASTDRPRPRRRVERQRVCRQKRRLDQLDDGTFRFDTNARPPRELAT